MNTTWFSLATLATLLSTVPSNPAQSARATDHRGTGLVRVPVDDDAREDATAADFDRDDWKKKLGASDLDLRERDLDLLIELARNDRNARRALEDWAKDKNGGELGWTARLALREVDRRASQPAPRRSLARPDARAGALDDLQRQMEEMQRHFGGMDSMFEDLQHRMDEMLRRPGASSVPAPGGAPRAGVQSRSQGFSLRTGPDGVEVEVLEDDNGTQHKKTYKAESLDALLDAHPELRDRISSGSARAPSGTWQWGQTTPLPGAAPDDQPFDGSARPLKPMKPLPPSGERLGIYCDPVGADDLKELGSDREGGLRVSSVVQGSFAELLGMQSGDVLVELDGKAITSKDDVASVLRERKRGAELRAEVVDEKGQSRTLRFTPKEKEPKEKDDASDTRRF